MHYCNLYGQNRQIKLKLQIKVTNYAIIIPVTMDSYMPERK